MNKIKTSDIVLNPFEEQSATHYYWIFGLGFIAFVLLYLCFLNCCPESISDSKEDRGFFNFFMRSSSIVTPSKIDYASSDTGYRHNDLKNKYMLSNEPNY